MQVDPQTGAPAAGVAIRNLAAFEAVSQQILDAAPDADEVTPEMATATTIIFEHAAQAAGMDLPEFMSELASRRSVADWF